MSESGYEAVYGKSFDCMDDAIREIALSIRNNIEENLVSKLRCKVYVHFLIEDGEIDFLIRLTSKYWAEDCKFEFISNNNNPMTVSSSKIVDDCLFKLDQWYKNKLYRYNIERR